MSDSKPTNTPVQPASAMSRIKRRIVGHVDRDGGAPDLLQRPQRLAQLAQVVAVGAEIVVDEDGVGLAVGRELGGDLLRVAHPIRHAQARRSPGSRSRSGCGSRAWRSGWWS